MAELKTKQNDQNVEAYLNEIVDEKKRLACFTILNLMREITGAEPKMWGSSIVGFGSQHYRYASGREGDWFLVGFSPRKQNLTLYLTYGFEQHTGLLEKLGRFKIGKACLYINKMEDVDLGILKKLIEQSVDQATKPRAP